MRYVNRHRSSPLLSRRRRCGEPERNPAIPVREPLAHARSQAYRRLSTLIAASPSACLPICLLANQQTGFIEVGF